jgi:hypothetical protein
MTFIQSGSDVNLHLEKTIWMTEVTNCLAPLQAYETQIGHVQMWLLQSCW